MIAIVDYGAGNIRSVINALERIGVHAKLTSNAEDLINADKVIFPGVGHARPAMDLLHEKNLVETLQNLHQPFLGICLGMQLMCSHSEEGDTPCLGIFPEKVKRFQIEKKVPHMGWNTCNDLSSSLFNGISEEDDFYFVHSFFVEPGIDTIASCTYGQPFAAALKKENYYGVQFHPEKSGKVGSMLLKNFIEL
jgi:glutamine amidotransferase